MNVDKEGEELEETINNQLDVLRIQGNDQQQQQRRIEIPPNVRHLYNALDFFSKIKTIGTGTFGSVYLVKHLPTGEYYALKRLNKRHIVKYKQVNHIKSERLLLGEIDHPFIVKLYASFQDSSYLYLLMEYVNGGELFKHLRQRGRFSNNTTKFYAAQVALAFEYLHDRDIIYRDLKPENVLLDSKGQLKITDFGFAKRVKDRTWTLCGTPEYLAPEVIQSKGQSRGVDWWALGILVYEMLVGYPPFYAETPFGIYEKIMRGRYRFPSHVGHQARDLIRRFLTADRTRRYGNMVNGVLDVKQHPWFAGMDWDLLYAGKIKAPIVPETTSVSDFSNYDDYPEENLVKSNQNTDEYKGLFDEFG